MSVTPGNKAEGKGVVEASLRIGETVGGAKYSAMLNGMFGAGEDRIPPTICLGGRQGGEKKT